MGKSGNKRASMKLLADFSTIGLTLASCVFIGFGIGYYIDVKLFAGRTKPWFMLIFLCFGVASGFLNLYRMAKRKDL